MVKNLFDGSVIKLIQDVSVGLVNNIMAKRQVAAAKMRPASSTRRKTIAPKKPEIKPTEETTPIVTFGSIELSAFRYNAPQMIPTEERRERFEREMEKEKAEKAAKYAAEVEAYKQRLEDLKHQKTEFNGLGLTSEESKRNLREWEAEQKRRLAPPKEIPYGHSPIKTCSN